MGIFAAPPFTVTLWVDDGAGVEAGGSLLWQPIKRPIVTRSTLLFILFEEVFQKIAK